MDRRPSPSVQGTGAFCIGRQVIGGKLRISPHHLRLRPAAQLLQREQRRAVLNAPARSGVPQIVPTKICYRPA